MLHERFEAIPAAPRAACVHWQRRLPVAGGPGGALAGPSGCLAVLGSAAPGRPAPGAELGPAEPAFSRLLGKQPVEQLCFQAARQPMSPQSAGPAEAERGCRGRRPLPRWALALWERHPCRDVSLGAGCRGQRPLPQQQPRAVGAASLPRREPRRWLSRPEAAPTAATSRCGSGIPAAT